MRKKTTMNRWALARRLQNLALCIAADRPIRIGGTTLRVPDEFVLEEEFETEGGKSELEFELKWRAGGAAPAKRGARGTLRRGRTG